MADLKPETTLNKPFLFAAMLKARPATFVDIIVGPPDDRQTFTIHKDLICHASPFFRGAFSGHFIEGQTHQMTIEDVRHTTFGIVAVWMYTKLIELSAIEEKEEKDKSNGVLQLGKVWIVAQRFIMPELQNHVLDMIYDRIVEAKILHLQTFYNLVCHQHAHLLIKLAAADYCHSTNKEGFFNHIDSLPHLMVTAVARIMREHATHLGSLPKRDTYYQQMKT